jgi:hypothetical protein
MATTKSKDLSPKKNPKGGRIVKNDNFTLIRAAKPKKDLSPSTSGFRCAA